MVGGMAQDEDEAPTTTGKVARGAGPRGRARRGGRAGPSGSAAEGEAGRDRPAGRLVDFDPWGALLGAMWGGPAGGGDAVADRPSGATGTAGRRARPAEAGRTPRRKA